MKLKNIFYFIFIILVTVLLFEFIYFFFYYNISFYNFENRFMLYSSDKSSEVFVNKKNFVQYIPNQKIHNKGYYFVNNRWIKEYDYFFKTNNLGLVQNNNVKKNIPSILFLGDSFLEGQGSEPWFNSFENTYSYKNYQLINGGFLATGFQQWYNLYKNVKEVEGIKINKIAIIFISDDLDRGIFQLDKNTLNCIKDYNVCVGHEGFYGIPHHNNLNNFLQQMYNARNQSKLTNGNFKKQFKIFFPGTQMLYSLSRSFIERKKNIEVIKKMINEFGDNIVFIHLPTKKDIYLDTFEADSKRISKIIISLGGNYVNGSKNCFLTKKDFLKYDGHPNKKGYSKISNCTNISLKEIFH